MFLESEKTISTPDSLAVGRSSSIFAEDVMENSAQLSEMIRGSKILVIGGAGSIGSNTIEVLSRFKPSCLHVIDQNENGLAELVRRLRSRVGGLDVDDFRPLPLNYGGIAFQLFLAESDPYDYVLNFAALKHVRSEKDHFSILEMMNTNLMLMSNLLANLKKTGSPKRFFSVSTDKAANPSSVMGATKRLMEHFMFDQELDRPSDMVTTSARFANVAYSNGSLLQSFENRFNLNQPLVAPRGCKRYFVSLNESGHICTLAAFLAPENTIAIPNLNPEEHLVLLEDVLFGFLEYKGYTPEIFESEDEARASMASSISSGRWPVLLTPLDTAGEKPYEEFVAEGELVHDIGLKQIMGVGYQPAEAGSVLFVQQKLAKIVNGDGVLNRAVNKGDLVDLIATVEPGFLATHKESESSLDQRM